MTTRRDLIKIASALGLAGTVPTSAERIAAMQILDQEVSGNVLLDPAGFADCADSLADTMDWLGAINPEEHAAYWHAHRQLEDAVPFLGGKKGYRAFGDWESAYFNLAMSCYNAGIRHGAAYENLRRSVIGELAQCRDCWGVGAREESGACKSCGGTGTVALEA